jgi:NAD(P)-dependent dehydrogenase (short-subunit alcohol dehydrogenase family)
MSTPLPIALIFGAGKNVGAAVVKAFTAKGYRIATVSRAATADASEKRLHVQADLADPESVSTVFEIVRKQLGHPSVVIYNGLLLGLFIFILPMLITIGAAASFVNKEDPLELSLKDAIRDMNINTFSALAAAKEAVKSFEALPKDAARTFIFTGNIMNSQPIPVLMSAGLGKSATAHMIQTAALVYADRGYK